MANPHKGEIAFSVGDKPYKLSFSANAMCELESAIEMDIDALVEKLKTGEGVRLAVLRTVFWQGLLDHQPDMSLDDTKALLKRLNPSEMGELIGRAFTASMPTPSQEGGGENANPPKPGGSAAAGTGPAS